MIRPSKPGAPGCACASGCHFHKLEDDPAARTAAPQGMIDNRQENIDNDPGTVVGSDRRFCPLDKLELVRLVFRLHWIVLLFLPTLSVRAQEEVPNGLAAVETLSGTFRDAAKRVIPATLKVIGHLRTSEEREKMLVEKSIISTAPDARRPGDAMGTGFLVDPRGIILTNRHVIGQAKEVEVELADGRRFKVLRIRHDEETDLAVLWIKPPERLPCVTFGDSDKLDIGDWVLAIGNPFDLDLTVSAGIISARGRSVRSVQRGDFLQTDASINPGNSGGPLVNIRGEVIGINTLIISQSGVGQGIGFALPSNTALWVLRQLVGKGTVERAWFGLEPQPVSDATAKRLGVKPREGVLAVYVVPESPAARAGVKKDDILLSVDGRPVATVVEYKRVEEQARIGVEHTLEILRGGQNLTLTGNAAPLPEAYKRKLGGIIGMSGGTALGFNDAALGLMLLEMNAEVSARGGYGTTGMAVINVMPGSRAEKAGFKKGMLIAGLDGTATPDRSTFVDARKKASLSDGIVLDIRIPGGNRSTITVKTGD